MESLQMLMVGFSVAMQPTNLLFAFIGCFMGTLIGVLPGIGPVAGMAMLFPVTYVLDTTPAIIMLAAIYYGAMYGGTITSVLINTPGEAASAITCLDGYEMARKGRAGAALTIAAIGSFIGGNVATMALVLVALPLTSLALKFGPPEFFSLMVLGLSLVMGLAGKSMTRALLSGGLGLLIALVGMDPSMGKPRFTFGQAQLLDGVDIVPVVMGLFGIGEIYVSIESRASAAIKTRLRDMMITATEARDSVWPIIRGSVVGVALGFIPGVVSIIPAFVSYVAERRLSRTPEKFGTGMIEGVAGPETANNAYANAAMIPLFTLGIPGNAVLAILMGAFMIHGLTPGPMLFVKNPELVWAIVASMYIGNVMLLILNLPLVPMWVSVLRIPHSILYAMILAFCVIGAYSISYDVFDVGVMLGFGWVGYAFKKLDIPIAPLVLTLVLGKLMESALRESLGMSQGDYSIFFTRPISATLLAGTAVFIISAAVGLGKQVRS